MYDREIKQRLSEGKAERVRALPSVSCFDRRSNIVNPAQKEAQTFGYSKDLITLSGTNSQLYITKFRGRPRDDLWIFLQACKEIRLFFAHTFVTIHC